MIKGVIFDLDGTLLNTIDDIADSMNFALRNFGFYEYVNDEYKYFVGQGVPSLVEAVLEDQTHDTRKKQHVQQTYLKKYAELQYNKTKPYPGIENMLIDMNFKNILIGVLSNKPDVATQQVIQRFFPNIFFDAVLGAREGVPIKPHPAGVKDILKKFDLRCEEVLYVGDTKTDILTAQNGKLKSVGVLWGFRTEAELVRANADYIISHPRELMDIIKELNA